MSVVTIIVGINHFDDLTEPLVNSIKEYEPSADIIVIDNGSDCPYPDIKGVEVLRINRCCYAKAINKGVNHRDADWYVILNNDVLCHGLYNATIEEYGKKYVYGKDMVNKNVNWLPFWMVVFCKEAYEEIGKLDERFPFASFEDVDWCYRAEQKGYQLVNCDLPFEHLELHTRHEHVSKKSLWERNRLKFFDKHGIWVE